MKLNPLKSVVAAAVVAATLPVTAEADAKNVIMLIGDGMGIQQVGLLETYANRAPNSPYTGDTAIAHMAENGKIVLSRTSPIDTLVVDSACSATQLAIGQPTLSEVIGIDADGNPAETLVQMAQRVGKSTGLVSDTRMTHATPASFAAHVAHRDMENEIAEQMVNYYGVDVLLSGGARHFLPAAVNEEGEVREMWEQRTDGSFSLSSRRRDDRDILLEAEQGGYSLAFNWEQMEAVEEGKILGLFAGSGMMDGFGWRDTKDTPAARTEPTLKEMTVKALDLLSQNDEGFFLMVEGGQIDWAGHFNDVGYMLQEMLKFDETIDYVYEWAAQRDDTLVILTADHETGSFGFSYNMTDIPTVDFSKTGVAFEGIGYKPDWNFGSLEILDKIANQTKAHDVVWQEFIALPAGEQTAARLASMLNEHNDFVITEEMAQEVMASEANSFFVANHSYLSAETIPLIHDYKTFYVYGEENRSNIVGRMLGEQQHVVWGTGTHTDTPVGVFLYGPEKYVDQFKGIMTHPEVGQIAGRAVLGE